MHLSLQPSLRLTQFFIVSHVGAITCLMLSDAPIWLKIIGSLVGFSSAWYSSKRYARLTTPNAITACIAQADGLWVLHTRQGQQQIAHLIGDSWRSRHLLVLNFKLATSRKRLSVLVYKDMLSATALRHLQAYLTVHAAQIST